MQFMFDDEEGIWSFGARAMARGDVERKILDYCKQHQLPFDVAFQIYNSPWYTIRFVN